MIDVEPDRSASGPLTNQTLPDESATHFGALPHDEQPGLRIQNETGHLKDQLVILESTLRQRDDAVAQAKSDAQHARDNAEKLSTQLTEVTHELDTLAQKLAEAESWVFELAGEREQAKAENERIKREMTLLENRLRQRSEEAEQAWAQAQNSKRIADQLAEELAGATKAREALAAKLADAEAWVFTLAGERRQFEIEQRRNQQVIKAEQSKYANLLRRAEADSAYHARIKTDFETLLKTTIANRDDVQHQLNVANSQLEAHATIIGEQAELLNQKSDELNLLRADQEMAMQRGYIWQHERDAQATKAATAERNVAWLSTLYLAEARYPTWWRLLPKSYRRRLQFDRLARKALFDAGAYLAANPDVAAEGMDPLEHFVRHGIHEGRSPFGHALIPDADPASHHAETAPSTNHSDPMPGAHQTNSGIAVQAVLTVEDIMEIAK